MSVNELRPPSADKKFEPLAYTDPNSRTFVFGDEDHTLGNALRHILMHRSETTFCGYSVPHPSEPKMNIRLQTAGKPSIELLREGLKEMVDICELLDSTVDNAIAEYEKNPPMEE